MPPFVDGRVDETESNFRRAATISRLKDGTSAPGEKSVRTLASCGLSIELNRPGAILQVSNIWV